MSIIDKLNGKRILIWGYGREGQSTEQFLKRCCQPASVEIFEGKRDGFNEDDYDWIVKSPGIVYHEANLKYLSQTEIFLEEYRDRVIGITGTKGKSTTSSMLYTVLKECSGKKVIILGNIGQPCLDYFEEVDDNTIVVFEMSCHQLAHTEVSPHIAIFLNFYEEHLDYYETVERYFRAKSNVARYQKAGDYFFKGDNVPEIETKAQVIEMKRRCEQPFDLNVLGEHNIYNAQFVHYIAVKLLGCNEAEVLESMKRFKGLPHRLEHIGDVNGVAFYDDSISTIPEATISAIKSVPDVQTVLIGGMDRGINYDVLIRFIKENKQYKYICMYDSGKRIYDAVGECAQCRYVPDLELAVEEAKRVTESGKACVLSPAAASYGYFKNFEERGEVFKQYVLG